MLQRWRAENLFVPPQHYLRFHDLNECSLYLGGDREGVVLGKTKDVVAKVTMA